MGIGYWITGAVKLKTIQTVYIMKVEIYQSDSDSSVILEPETVEESTVLARLAIRGNFKLSEAVHNFNTNGGQRFTLTVPANKTRAFRGYSMIRNKDLKVI